MSLFRFLKITCLVLPLSLVPFRAAQAEVDLGTWNTYATMAEQGAVCGAFADIMAVVQRTGGIEATREAALKHQTQAMSALETLGQNEATVALSEMAGRAVDRRG